MRFGRTLLSAAMALAIVGVAVPSARVGAATDGLAAAFTAIRGGTVWPVQGGTRDAITSTLGPRIRAATDAYDWHRGIDLHAPEGTPVVAALAGDLFGVRDYADGGLTVIVRHAFPEPVLFQGRTLSHFYTFHMHLSEIAPALVAAAAAGETPAVARGERIGRVGHTGNALSDHLHWELRVGTPYSLEWQLANPGSRFGADAFGFDPHVHPMLLVPPPSSHGMSLSVTTKPALTADGLVRIVTSDDDPLLDRIEVRVVRRSDGRLLQGHTLDLDERIGYDARSTAALDTPDTTRPWLSPVPFGSTSTWTTRLVVPASWWSGVAGVRVRTTVRIVDAWGRSTSLSW